MVLYALDFLHRDFLAVTIGNLPIDLNGWCLPTRPMGCFNNGSFKMVAVVVDLFNHYTEQDVEVLVVACYHPYDLVSTCRIRISHNIRKSDVDGRSKEHQLIVDVLGIKPQGVHVVRWYTISLSIWVHSIPFHSIPFHSIPFHSIYSCCCCYLFHSITDNHL